jgi:hypothetical protein
MAYHPHTGFHYSILLTLLIMVALTMFETRIWVGVGTGKLLIDLGFINFFNTKITWSGSMVVPGWMDVLLHYSNGLNFIMD